MNKMFKVLTILALLFLLSMPVYAHTQILSIDTQAKIIASEGRYIDGSYYSGFLDFFISGWSPPGPKGRSESICRENMKAAMREDDAAPVSPYGSLYAVSEKKGNIFITDKKEKTKQLTFSGKDSQPSLSPDEKTVVFVRNTPEKKIEVNIGPENEVGANEIWIIDSDGQNLKIVMAAGRKSESSTGCKNLARLSSPQFSADGKRIYFMSMGWNTSDAIYIVDLDTKKLQFVTDGNSLEIIKKGKYTGYLIVKKHRYFLGGGSGATYNWFWLLSPFGEENAPLGETDKNFKDLFVK